MPAYFEMSLQFLYPGFLADFDARLERSGLLLLENDSLPALE